MPVVNWELKHPSRRKWYEKRKAEHRCVLCGTVDERTLSGRVHCVSCQQFLNRKNADYRARQPKKEKAPPMTAEERKEKQRQAQNALRARRYEEHRCRECGHRDARTAEGGTICAACAEYRRRRHLAMKKEKK